ncbi:MAG TPA: serine hydrolase domain-containing protein, partial [Roseiflexaceae bacterium]|nr:serine hydrolase domain-containing protein [Roseiflexaceae bacterium]
CAPSQPATTAPSAAPVAATAAPVEATAAPAASPAATAPASSPAAPEATNVATAAPAAGGAETDYTEPGGRFSVPVPTNWQTEQRDGFVVLSDPDRLITAYALAVEEGDPEAALAAAWKLVDPATERAPADVQTPPPANGVERVVTATYEGAPDRVVIGRGKLYQGITYVLLVDADAAAFARRQAQMQIIESGYTIAAIPVVDLRGVRPAPVDEAVTSELAAFTERVRTQFRVPGVALAVVQDGRVVYSAGFGVRNAATGAPITPQTRMMIGSTGKSMTTMMMATLVDDGTMDWDTPAQQILPSFAVRDPELSKRITVRNLVCACTGVPRRDFELIFNAQDQSAEDIIASLASFEFFTGFGEAFQYSNQMVATGGYLATVADGRAPGNLLEDYGAVLKARVLDPIGMPNTTLSFAEVEAGDNYAVPHSPDLAPDAAYLPRPLRLEEVLKAGAPAGVHWSTAEDMANYLITELNRGVGPGGNRVVSAENLEETWRPQVPVDATTQYGLGWFVGSYKQQPLIHHGGNTLGFTSDFAFLPDAGLGIVVLANGSNTNTMNEAIRTRLFELVFDQPAEVEAAATFALQQDDARVAQLAGQLADAPDAAALASLAGRYTSDALGEVTVAPGEGGLVLDAGEFQTLLKPLRTPDAPPNAFLMAGPPLPGIRFLFTTDTAGTPSLVMEVPPEPYTFTRAE